MSTLRKSRKLLESIINQHKKRSNISNTRIPYIASQDINKVRALKEARRKSPEGNTNTQHKKKTNINAKANKNLIFSRKTTVLSSMLDSSVLVHNGQRYQLLHININMIGHRLGEFVATYKQPNHTSANKENKKK